MKIFKISFVFEADDDWEAKDVKEMVTAVLCPVYSVGGAFVDKFVVEEIRGKVDENEF